MYGIGKRSGLSGAGNKTGRTIGKSKRAIRRLNEREQMHMRAPSAVHKTGVNVNLKTRPPQSFMDVVRKSTIDNAAKHGYSMEDIYKNPDILIDIPGSRRASQQGIRMGYDELMGREGIPADEFESRRRIFDMALGADAVRGIAPKRDPKSDNYQLEIDSLRKTLGGRSYTGLTSRTKRGPR